MLQYDGPVDIAIGRSRRETRWKNKSMLWSDIVAWLSVTHRTAETYAEYIASDRTRQDEIKDIGGFVGGYLVQGQRRNGCVAHRQLITLDLDTAPPGLWERYVLQHPEAAIVYSTHKHTPDKPRLRLILPLNRPVFADEYMPIARRIAADIGIEFFDPTTFEPVRLMYRPSTSVDGTFFNAVQDGPWWDADAILSTYRDWRDSSAWPTSNRAQDIIASRVVKQGDPLDKPGMVGAFCRSYTIAEAISTYLASVYLPTDHDGRYTLAAGSTSGGLVVYDDVYAYSHHGTDAISGKLCNAFDLVRLHLFGSQDQHSPVNTGITQLPSYLQMCELAAKSTLVRGLVARERAEQLKADFGVSEAQDEAITDTAVEEDTEWATQLGMDRKGNYHPTIDNLVLILENDPKLKWCFALDIFEQQPVLLRDMPWRKIGENGFWLDSDDSALRHYIEKIYNISNATKLNDALEIVFMQHSFHPIRDYLNSVHWDGVERIDTLLIDFLGAEDSEYTRAVSSKMLVAAAKRVFEPGCKFDYIVTLVGTEGLKKSMLIDKLGGKWFSDSLTTVVGVPALEQLRGVWIAELAELAALKRAEVEAVKAYVTKRTDRYRPAFARRGVNLPRQCIFMATTNSEDFLKGHTGARRFWPVPVYVTQPEKDIGAEVDKCRDQIWAEAVQRYRDGEKVYLDESLEEIAKTVQAEHSEVDDRAAVIMAYMDMLVPDNWETMTIYERRAYLQQDDSLQPELGYYRNEVCAAEIWCELFAGSLKDMNSYNTKFIHAAIQNVRYKEVKWKYKGTLSFKLYGKQRTYVRTKRLIKID